MERHRIVKIQIAAVETTFGRMVGRNSKGENYGINQREWLVQATTDSGLMGLTNARPAMNSGSVQRLAGILGELLGRDLFEFHRLSGGLVTGVPPRWSQYLLENGFVSYLLFDLMGKALGTPAYGLLGSQVRARIEAYDSTLYFQDLVRPDEGAGAVASDAAEAVRKGWQAVKIKLGRPGRWFEPNAGMHRDVEVVLRTREAVGDRVKILVDANNGYDGKPALLEAFVRETASARIFWMEEMITEDLSGYRRLRDWRDRHTPSTMLVDGEGHQGRNPIYWKLMEEGLLDAIQPDMLHMGFWPYWQLALEIRDSGFNTKIAPHNFNAAATGLRGVIQFGAACPAFVIAEDSTLAFDLYRVAGGFEGGSYLVTQAPGLGVEVDPEVYRRRHAATETVLHA